jgi:peptidoglycan/xylan/chitin deacetylase (PgdA/CDA1 family)
MMSVGLHARIIGRPGRAASLSRFLDYVVQHDKVWVCRREDIAKHWIEHHPPKSEAALLTDVVSRKFDA